MAPDIVGAPYVPIEVPSRYEQGNPLTNWFPTKDGRWIYLVLLQADRYWAELCAYLGAAELVVDERFTDAEVRHTHRVECVNALTEVFLSRTLNEWKDALRDFSGVWAPVQSALEVHEHAQVRANGFLPQVRTSEGVEFALVAPPMHFNGEVTAPTRCAPALGADTDEILRELGYDAAAIEAMRQQKVFG
jgi:formyl-CoA transferase